MQSKQRRSAFGALLMICAVSRAWAGGEQTLEPVTVTANRAGLIGAADSASE